jgi:hypothetical protein
LETARESWESNTFGSGSPDSEAGETRYVFRGCHNPFLLKSEGDATAFLPAEDTPLAWRLAIFLHEWKTAAETAP